MSNLATNNLPERLQELRKSEDSRANPKFP